MNNFRKIRTKILGVKTLGYRAISFIIQTILLTIFLACGFNALLVSVLLTVQKTIVYFIYDYYFAKYFSISKDKGFVLWATGVSGVGKTTLLNAVAKELNKTGIKIERLDGDIVRKKLCSDLGFSKEDRDSNIKRVTFVAKLLSRNGVGVLASFITPYKRVRDNIKKEVTNYIELYLTASTKERIKRDPKGLYKKAIKGEIKNLTGYNGTYQNPINPDIIINTEEKTIKESVDIVINYLKKRKLI